eukprot:TRINITY_DN5366_c0_g1_i1.p1 TRINITY_DN5366_c0_g1~~TRINITY_DN5366_c0_g1_i1.p1  ORF type:complete len:378 (-),score=108.59 TRINITY_DN5366_c0_g1_i1:176-1225(-)
MARPLFADLDTKIEQILGSEEALQDSSKASQIQDQVKSLITKSEKTYKNEPRWPEYLKQQADRLKNKGNEYFNQNQDTAAFLLFSLATLFDPSNHILFSNRSGVLTRTGNYHAAIDDAKTCISLAPNWPKGYSRLGAAYFGANKYDEAFDAYKKGLALDPNNAQILTGMDETKKKVEALDANERGEEMISKNRLDRAVDYFTKAIELDPSNSLYFINRNKTYLMTGQPNLALEDAEKAIFLRPNWAKGYGAQADALFSLGDYEKSAFAYTSALQLEPDQAKYKRGFDSAVQESTKQRLAQQTKNQTPTNPSSSPASPPAASEPALSSNKSSSSPGKSSQKSSSSKKDKK